MSGRREEKEEERDHIDRLSFSLSFFLSFTRFWEYDSGNYKVPDLNFHPSLLLLFGEKRLFFYQSKNRKKSNFERYKNNIFSIYRKEEGRKRALKSAHLRRRDGRVLFFSRLSFCLSLSLCERPRKIGAMMMQNATT